MDDERDFDVVVYGATGFTGELTARYLAKKGETSRWAIAGRNREKLERVRTELASIDAALEDLEILIARSDDQASLEAMTSRTKVVLSTVGPFIEYGEPLVAACVETGTDYCDITGEPEFVELTIAKYGDAAMRAGVRIVSCCGFDSIPHDLGAWLTARQLPSNEPMVIEGFVRSKGTFSGGTWQSAIQAMANFRSAAKARKSRPRRPAPDGRKVGLVKPKVHREKKLGAWAVPLPTIDPDVVRRSAKLLPEFGPDFRYGHYARVKHLTTVVGAGLAVGGLFALSQFPPTRMLLQKVKTSGDGPDEAERSRSWFQVTFLGRAGGETAHVEVAGGDPGYDETSKMLAEAALAMALDGDALPDRSGVLTTATGIGQPLLDRLRDAGLTFDVVAASMTR